MRPPMRIDRTAQARAAIGRHALAGALAWLAFCRGFEPVQAAIAALIVSGGVALIARNHLRQADWLLAGDMKALARRGDPDAIRAFMGSLDAAARKKALSSLSKACALRHDERCMAACLEFIEKGYLLDPRLLVACAGRAKPGMVAILLPHSDPASHWRGMTALHAAAAAGCAASAELLLPLSDARAMDWLGHTPRQCAQIAGHRRVAELIGLWEARSD